MRYKLCKEDTLYQKVLPCKHSFCEPCISKLAKPGLHGQQLICSCCRLSTDVSKEGVLQLPTKFFAKLSCEFCSQKKDIDEIWWCKNCEMTLCR